MAMVQNVLSSGMRVLIRGQEWLVTKVETNDFGNQTVQCTGVSPLVRDYQATFLSDLDEIIPVDPRNTRFVPDDSPHAAKSHLFIESLLRTTVPTDARIHVGNKAAMDSLPYQLLPTKKALSQPRQRILIADAVGLGKTLEAGILMSELIKRHKGRRILVVTAKSMMLQFQKEMWERFTIPLVSLDSSRIQQIRAEIPANANPFSYYDKVIVSVDTLKRDLQYGAALDASYWDIIVIDEAQNVADRGNGTARAQRSRLAERLANRSDTLIMLSATPHDGRARSFASLMNMLDPTTLPDPENYSKDDVEHLYVRRFKKDVIGDVSGNFPERKVTQERCAASPQEEAAFDYLTGMELKMDTRPKNSNAGLFKTLLEKSLFSSPAACVKTVDERIKRLTKRDSSDPTGDIKRLGGLRDLLERITPESFSRYQRLLSLLNSADYGWTGKDSDDRIVIFTERIETKNWLEEHLREDLKLPAKAIVSMDGGMNDLEQQRIVEEFGRSSSPIRVLIASDVASEGLNLHHLSHRLIHFDTPWSLMVFQQRNGRIDRYGQRKQPDIRFMGIDSRNEKIKGDVRILEILQEKEEQARNDIGDPALLMGKFDIEEEEAVTVRAIESGESAEEFSRHLDVHKEDIDTTDEQESDDFDFLALAGLKPDDDEDEDDGETDDESDGGAESKPDLRKVTSKDIDDSETLMSDYSYVREGLSLPEFSQSAGIVSKRDLPDGEGISVTFGKDSPLRTWLRRRVPNAEVLRNDTAIWSPDKDYCARVADNLVARLKDEQWSQTQYLWELNPIVEWVGLKASSLLYRRDEAPIIGVSHGMEAGEIILLMSGMVANRRATPVIDQWFGLQYINGEFNGDPLTLDEVWKRTGYKGSRVPGRAERQYANREQDVPSEAQVNEAMLLLDDAVARAEQELMERKAEYAIGADTAINEQLTRIDKWSGKRREVLAQHPNARHDVHEVNDILTNYTQWVEGSLTASGNPVIRVAAAFVGTENGGER